MDITKTCIDKINNLLCGCIDLVILFTDAGNKLRCKPSINNNNVDIVVDTALMNKYTGLTIRRCDMFGDGELLISSPIDALECKGQSRIINITINVGE